MTTLMDQMREDYFLNSHSETMPLAALTDIPGLSQSDIGTSASTFPSRSSTTKLFRPLHFYYSNSDRSLSINSS